ncbi:DUF559 domain-containing protein [Acinetobacter lwoffii]|uniref:DUF559 domain-containing protein n=1 Tax=Acinetobacter lwoffii TaxID=28090 RepID=UPI001FF37527|nr:DUF559 domain-containing protein [Acinetobacter lwoffii]MCJ8512240.1 endonuclease domain-containing protein [Acinetobacter lwoffii]
MATIIRGIDPRYISTLPSLEERIEQRYKINNETKKPFNIQELSKRIGEKPSLLLCAMLSDPHCSKFGVECLIEVLAGIADNNPIYVSSLDYGPNQTRPFNFTLMTQGFLNEEFINVNNLLGERDHACFSFTFIPENKISQSDLRNGQSNIKGKFSLDLTIELHMTIFADQINHNTKQHERIVEDFLIGKVVIEFDGINHLNDEQVRKDKLRDSMIQGEGFTVFRIQMPYQHAGKGSNKINKENLSILLKGQIEDIKNYFKNTFHNAISVNYLLHSLIREGFLKTAPPIK